ncbi:MAG: substrate-binding domain-containing protein, partial [Mycobacterium sp.]|nr:substrate-binding domain-containing protein [Mycobacterium sp.]
MSAGQTCLIPGPIGDTPPCYGTLTADAGVLTTTTGPRYPDPMSGLLRSTLTRSRAAAGVVAIAAVATTSCSASSNADSSHPAAGSSSKAAPPGTVHVLYAGSLVNLMEHDLGPKFAKASGAKYEGYGAGSTQVAKEITGKVHSGDVFISADPDVNNDLEGAKNGNYVNWYVTFAKAPLLIGYNPKSKFAHDLKTKPWYDVITESGIRVGRTDPTLDPKGKLTAQAFEQAAKKSGHSDFASKVEKSVAVYPEETLVGRLQSGQLDAGFFYANEAEEQHIPTVGLGSIKLSATYTVSALNHAKNPSSGLAFVEYLLGPQGKQILTQHGLTVVPYTAGGDKKD